MNMNVNMMNERKNQMYNEYSNKPSGKSLVEQTAMNGELPTTKLENGFEATVIAGIPNHHLSLENAITCPIARSYFVKAFAALNDDDKAGWLEAHEMTDLSVLGIMLYRDVQNPFIQLLLWDNETALAAQVYDDAARAIIVDTLNNNSEALKAFSLEAHKRFNEYWLPKMQKSK